MRSLWLTLIAALLSSCAFPSQSMAQPAPAGTIDWHGSDGSFTALFFFAADPDEFYRSWNETQTPKISNLEKAVTGQHFEAIVIFSECTADDKGNCRIVTDWTVKASDGRIISRADAVRTWYDRRAGRPGELMIAEHGVGMGAEAGVTGKYLFEAVVHDELGGKTVRLRREIAVVSSPGLAFHPGAPSFKDVSKVTHCGPEPNFPKERLNKFK